jgi:hypothetical protein
VLLAVPMLVANVPLGVDDLNHLARIYVRAHVDADPDLARVFAVRGDPIPYLGMDLLLTPLARVLPIMLVGRIYLVGLVWGLVGAVMVLRRVFVGRVGLAPAVVGLIAWNGLMAWGLVNYVLGLVLVLLVFAAWHAWRDWNWLARLAVFAIAATAIYLTHLLAFVLYGILVVSYEVFGRARPWQTPVRDWVVLAGQAVPGLLLWHALSGRMTIADFSIEYWLPSKLYALESPFLFGGTLGGMDAGILVAWFCAVVVCIGLWRGWLTWPRTLAAPVLVLLALTVLLPYRAFGITLTDYRFAVPAACIALAGLRLTAPRGRAIGVALLLFMVAHVADVSAVMHKCDAQYAELRQALAALPRGAELSTVLEWTEPKAGAACTSLPIYLHIDQLVTLDRSGYARDFFSRVTSVAVLGGRPTDTDPTPADEFTEAPASGYLLWIDLGRSRPVPDRLVPLRHGSFFDLWAVTPRS